MSSEELKDHLVDLLYDDELDDETRASMRREVESSDEARRELEEFEQMLGMIRESTPEEGPSESVHASIMDAAREHAENATRERAAATERAPRVPSGDDEQGLWSRISGHQVTQLALAACAILGAGFLFYVFSMQGDQASAPTSTASSEQATFEEAGDPSEGTVSLDEKEVAQAETEPVPAEAEESEESGWLERPRGQAKGDRGDEGGLIDDMEAAQKEKAPSPRPRPAARKDSLANKEAEAPARRRAPAKKSKTKLGVDGDKFDPFAGSDSETKSSSNNVFGARDAPKAESQKQREARGNRATDTSGIASSLGLGETSSGARQEPQAAQPTPSVGSESDESAIAATEEQSTSTQSDATSGTSISDVETAYRSGNDQRVLTRADDIIDSGTAAGSQVARALELKGLSLRRMGRLQDADRTLSRLQSEYPDYKPSYIQRVRADIAKSEREKREANRRKRKPAQEDEIEMMPESDDMQEPADATEQSY